MIGVGVATGVAERAAAVVGDLQLHAEVIDPLRVQRIDTNLTKEPRDRLEIARACPCRANIVGAEDAAVLGRHRRVQRVWLRPCDVDADSTTVARRQSVLQLRPRVTTIRALPERA